MQNYKVEELTEALRAINSIIHKCEKAQEKFPEGNSHHTLLKNRLKAMYISKELITHRLSQMPKLPLPKVEEYNPDELISNLDLLHTTALGAERIRRNLNLNTDDVVAWCKEQIKSQNTLITRKGKNWYIIADCIEITVNANSYTIITAHLKV